MFNKNPKVVAKFGMMHLIATNVCIVFRTLVKETLKEFAHADFAPEKEALEDGNNQLDSKLIKNFISDNVFNFRLQKVGNYW